MNFRVNLYNLKILKNLLLLKVIMKKLRERVNFMINYYFEIEFPKRKYGI